MTGARCGSPRLSDATSSNRFTRLRGAADNARSAFERSGLMREQREALEEFDSRRAVSACGEEERQYAEPMAILKGSPKGSPGSQLDGNEPLRLPVDHHPTGRQSPGPTSGSTDGVFRPLVQRLDKRTTVLIQAFPWPDDAPLPRGGALPAPIPAKKAFREPKGVKSFHTFFTLADFSANSRLFRESRRPTQAPLSGGNPGSRTQGSSFPLSV